MLLLLRFFTFFYVFQNPKSRDFLRFFAVFRTFSRTMMNASKGRNPLGELVGN